MFVTFFRCTMAVYFDHRAQAPFSGQNTDLQWHKSYALLATATFNESGGGSVIIYQEEVTNNDGIRLLPNNSVNIRYIPWV